MKKFVFIFSVMAFVSAGIFAQEVEAEEKDELETVQALEEVAAAEDEAPDVDSILNELFSELNGETSEESESEISEAENEEVEEIAEVVVDPVEELTAHYKEVVALNESAYNKNDEAVTILSNIESKKEEIKLIRELIAEQAEIYNKEVDEKTAAAISAVMDAPIDISESDGNGGISTSAYQRRLNKKASLIKEADDMKGIYLEGLKTSLGADEKKNLTLLSGLYKNLESGKFVDTTYFEDFVTEIGDFNTDAGIWPVTYTASLFGIENIFTTTVQIPYADITGEKYIPLDKMTDEQFMAFHEKLTVYTKALRNAPEVLYGKLTFSIYRWKQASEYRLIPEKFEVSLLDSKPKSLVKKTSGLTPKIFIIKPALEVRSENEIQADVVKANKIIAHEAKANETEEDKLYKEYTTSYESSKKSTSKEPLVQSGRGLFLISAGSIINQSTMGQFFDTSSESFADKVKNNISLDVVAMELDFPVMKFAFWGINAGLYLPVTAGNLNFEAGLNMGLNLKVTKWLRPYLLTGIDADTLFNATLKLGAGVDLMLGGFTLNIGYDYRWAYDFNNQLNPKVDKSTLTNEELNTIPCTNKHKFSIGVGYGW